MSKFNMYAIRDVKTAFMQPFIAINHQSAMRGFHMDLVNAKGSNSMMGFAPEDFDLYYIGTFDNDSGVVSPLTVPELVQSGSLLEV